MSIPRRRFIRELKLEAVRRDLHVSYAGFGVGVATPWAKENGTTSDPGA